MNEILKNFYNMWRSPFNPYSPEQVARAQAQMMWAMAMANHRNQQRPAQGPGPGLNVGAEEFFPGRSVSSSGRSPDQSQVESIIDERDEIVTPKSWILQPPISRPRPIDIESDPVYTPSSSNPSSPDRPSPSPVGSPRRSSSGSFPDFPLYGRGANSADSGRGPSGY